MRKQTHGKEKKEIKQDPSTWKTGDQPMTQAQRNYLKKLSHVVCDELKHELTKAEASRRIDQLSHMNDDTESKQDSPPAENDTQAGSAMTEAQSAYLTALTQKTGETFDPQLTKGEASRKIDELRNKSHEHRSADEIVQHKNPFRSRTAGTSASITKTKTGDQPMTAAQRSFLKALSDKAGEEFDGNLSKAEASRRIDELKKISGRSR
jgi:hypothetical protein